MTDLTAYEYFFKKDPVAHIITDHEGKILEVNEGFCTIVGIPMDRVLTIKMSDFRTQGILKYLEDKGGSFADCIAQKKITIGESTWQAPNGIHTMIRTNIPLLDDKGNLKYVYVSYVEITKVVKTRKFMEHEVGELAKVYAEIAKGDLTLRYEIAKPDDDTKEVYEQIVRLRDAVRV